MAKPSKRYRKPKRVKRIGPELKLKAAQMISRLRRGNDLPDDLVFLKELSNSRRLWKVCIDGRWYQARYSRNSGSVDQMRFLHQR